MFSQYELKVAASFFLRDFKAYKGSIVRYLINNGIISPLLFTFTFGYVLPAARGLAGQALDLDIFLGFILWALLPASFLVSFNLLMDINSDKFSFYQATLISPKLLILEKIVFSTFVCFVISLPFYPCSLLFLNRGDVLLNTDWVGLLLILLSGAFLFSVFQFLFLLQIGKVSKMDNLWVRLYYPLIIFGGEIVSRHAIVDNFPFWGKVALLNPFIYITEGAKYAILHNNRYLPVHICVASLIGISLFSIPFVFFYFRKQIDHV